MVSHVTRAVVLFISLLTLVACASNKAYHPRLTTCQMAQGAETCARHALVRYVPSDAAEYRLGFVEFDDQGQLRDRRQMEAVLDSFREIAGQEDVLLVTYVHGWHHNAHYEDDNVREFSKLLKKVAQNEAATSRRKVLGVYIGWRGDSLLIPGLRYLTFWERKNTAHKVGTNGVAEFLLKLEEIVNVKEGMESTEPKPRNSRMVLIGHSFGGAVVFTALQQILQDRFIDSRPGKTMSDTAKGFGDLVVLVNPAFEALRYASLYDLSRERCRYLQEQLPKLAILTSEADWATGLAFPAGRFFSTLFESHLTLDRVYCSPAGTQTLHLSEGAADRTAVGHFEPFRTHALRAAAGPQAFGVEALSLPRLQQRWSQLRMSEPLQIGGTRLDHVGTADPRNPYLNIYVDGELIPDHNKIWDDRIASFLGSLIAISTLPKTGDVEAAK